MAEHLLASVRFARPFSPNYERMFTNHQQQHFWQHGYLHLPGQLDAATLAPLRQLVNQRLEEAGLMRDGGWVTSREPEGTANIGKPRNPLKALKRSRLLAGTLTPLLLDAWAGLDQTRSTVPLGPAQLLFTPPNATTWVVPHSVWHVDIPRLPQPGCPGMQAFTFLNPVGQGGGGTLIVAGSHRLVQRNHLVPSRNVKRELRKLPWFHDLLARDTANRDGFMAPSSVNDDVEVQVVEMTGQPGDVYLTDLRVLHTLAPNVTRVPRVMLTQRLARSDLMAAFAGESISKTQLDAVG